MKLSTDRILTTHVGSLPRPDALLDVLEPADRGDPIDEAALQNTVKNAVRDSVAQQIETGIDIVSDGEMGKISYTFYVKHRLSGIREDLPPDIELPDEVVNADLKDHPDFQRRINKGRSRWGVQSARPWCGGPVEYANHAPLERDIENLNAAMTDSKPMEAFMNAASPGVLTKFVPNVFYKTEDAYVTALAEAMKVEYEAIAGAGYLLQIDCPDFGSARHNQYQMLSDAEFIRVAERNREALDYATANIPPERMRLHICWGNYEGPHTHDFPLAKIFGVLMKARPAGILFEGANPRHAHEWEDIQDLDIPDHKILIPGVVDSTSNFVEHPKLIAQRICHYAEIVGRERVIAGTDCGFGTFARREPPVAPSIVWSKFRAMAEGARLATERLWG
jgi:5-methyltetrahydropteroyltriglutamate--homocysteine methyltransferase